MTRFDVVVEGAGPAGATAAYYLAKQGRSVALVDRAKFPREKACGGGLCVHIEEFDHIVDNWDDFLESKCTRGIVYGPGGLAVDYTQETPFFYNIRRYTFDNKLVEYAVEAGATLVGGCCGTSPQHIAAIRDVRHAAHLFGHRSSDRLRYAKCTCLLRGACLKRFSTLAARRQALAQIASPPTRAYFLSTLTEKRCAPNFRPR